MINDPLDSKSNNAEEVSLVDSLDSVAKFNSLPPSVQTNTHLCLYFRMMSLMTQNLTSPILIDYLIAIGLDRNENGTITAIGSFMGVPGTILTNILLSYNFILGLNFTAFCGSISYLLFIYGASQSNLYLLYFSRAILGIAIISIPSKRYIFAVLPKEILAKYSFIMTALECLACALAPFVCWLVGIIYEESTVSTNPFVPNRYSLTVFVGFIIQFIFFFQINFFFSQPTNQDNSNTHLVAERPFTEYAMTTLFLFSHLLIQSLNEVFRLVLPLYNKAIASVMQTMNMVNFIVCMQNLFVFLFIVLFKKSLDKLPKQLLAYILCFVISLLSVLCLTWFTSNFYLYSFFSSLIMLHVYLLSSFVQGVIAILFIDQPENSTLNAGFFMILLGATGKGIGSLVFKMEGELMSAEQLINFLCLFAVGGMTFVALVVFTFREKLDKFNRR